MRRLVINTFLTLDGVMQAPGGPEEDPSGGFTHGGWSVKYWDEGMGRRMGEFMGRASDLLLGRRTYEIFAAYWPHSSDEPAATQLNSATKYVASRTLESVDWQNSHLIKGDVVKGVADLKKHDGPEIQVHGSANLIQTLLKAHLIDQFGLWIFPVVLGTGKRLFAEGTIPSGLKLVDSETFSTGVIAATYEHGAEIGYGSFALEEPTEAELERRKGLQAEEGAQR